MQTDLRIRRNVMTLAEAVLLYASGFRTITRVTAY
jgi:hypothetical protein